MWACLEEVPGIQKSQDGCARALRGLQVLLGMRSREVLMLHI